jgi:hypothetical protein
MNATSSIRGNASSTDSNHFATFIGVSQVG